MTTVPEPEESEYTVTWEIQLDGTSPREVAEKALAILMSTDPDNIGKVFEVTKSGERRTVYRGPDSAVVIDLSPGAGTTDLDLSTDRD